MVDATAGVQGVKVLGVGAVANLTRWRNKRQIQRSCIRAQQLPTRTMTQTNKHVCTCACVCVCAAGDEQFPGGGLSVNNGVDVQNAREIDEN